MPTHCTSASPAYTPRYHPWKPPSSSSTSSPSSPPLYFVASDLWRVAFLSNSMCASPSSDPDQAASHQPRPTC
eukprot:3238727-Rhodomonas_salina.2